MYLKFISIKNFRALEDVEIELNPEVNVIVGPNAIGKSTILEAIKLAKAMIAPRTQNESQQSLLALNATTPYNPQQIVPHAIARDPSKTINIRCDYQFSADEMNQIDSSSDQIVTNLIQARLGPSVNLANLAALLSSPQGQEQLSTVKVEIEKGRGQLRDNNGVCRIEAIVDAMTGRITTPNPVGAALFAFLDSRLPPNMTKFSYFPADRAFPKGEQPVQLGVQDAVMQLESHNSQPALKYSRLKNLIFTTIISGDEPKIELEKDFGDIFESILKGRQLAGFGINQYGQLSINIREVDTGRVFDIDAMSSGEKGLILTFITITKTISDSGIVLLDEPELHLNPAVCKHMLEFLIDKFVIKKKIQFIICSHSPEILGEAFSREECSLFHLRSASLITRVRRQDQAEVNDALKRLGTSESETLLYKATIFVEGEQDVELLDAGFGSLLRNYMRKELGGRKEIEKQIRLLQDAEKTGEPQPKCFFIFDRDEAPTKLKSSKFVKILQWNKRCLENYLIDTDTITDLLKSKDTTKTPVSNVGEVSKMLKRLAFTQIREFAARDVYSTFQFPSLNMRSADIDHKTIDEMVDGLASRMESVKASIAAIDASAWKIDLKKRIEIRTGELEQIWEDKWKDICDGKRLFKDLQQERSLLISIDRFKTRLMIELRNSKSDTWRSAESLLLGLLNEADT